MATAAAQPCARRRARPALLLLGPLAAVVAGGFTAAAESQARAGDTPFSEFAAALQQSIDAVQNASLAFEWRMFLERHRLSESDVPYRDYRRVRLTFEATRDGGFWQIRWAVTNRQPTSAAIWKQWARAPDSRPAVAECDEISALTAFLARRIGVGPVGLYWPTRNHTIVAWTPVKGRRVLLPTTQVFLRCEEGFDRAGFPPPIQRTVYDYTARDVGDAAPIPGALATTLLARLVQYARGSPALWDLLRYHRHSLHPSSTDGCASVRRQLAARLRATGTREDETAAAAYVRTELGLPSPATFEEALTLLSSAGGS